MRIWSIGALTMAGSVFLPSLLGVSITPIGLAISGVLAIQSVLAFVAAAAFRRANDDASAMRRGLAALGLFLVLAAVVTVAFTFDLGAPSMEELQ